jgi:hypothetical protein
MEGGYLEKIVIAVKTSNLTFLFLFYFVVYLTIPSNLDYIAITLAWFKTDKLTKDLKKSGSDLIKALSRHVLLGTEKKRNHKNSSVGIAYSPAENRIQNLQNKNLDQ